MWNAHSVSEPVCRLPTFVSAATSLLRWASILPRYVFTAYVFIAYVFIADVFIVNVLTAYVFTAYVFTVHVSRRSLCYAEETPPSETSKSNKSRQYRIFVVKVYGY